MALLSLRALVALTSVLLHTIPRWRVHLISPTPFSLRVMVQIMSEFLLISETSAITLTIAGVVKECVTIVVRTRWLCPSTLGLCKIMHTSCCDSGLVFPSTTIKTLTRLQVSVIIFGDEFGYINVLGLVIVIAGVSIFNLIK